MLNAKFVTIARKDTYDCAVRQERSPEQLFEQEPRGVAIHSAKRVIQENILGWGIDSTGKSNTTPKQSARVAIDEDVFERTEPSGRQTN